MVLEVFTALGLASSIVQFVDFGCNLFSKASELHQSAEGVSTENADLEIIARSLERLSDGLIKSTRAAAFGAGQSADEDELRRLAEKCRSVAGELLSVLGALGIQGSNTRWKSFRQALLSMWKKPKVEKMTETLLQFRRQMNACLIKILT